MSDEWKQAIFAAVFIFGLLWWAERSPIRYRRGMPLHPPHDKDD